MQFILAVVVGTGGERHDRKREVQNEINDKERRMMCELVRGGDRGDGSVRVLLL